MGVNATPMYVDQVVGILEDAIKNPMPKSLL